MSNTVPNLFPTSDPGPLRLALIGEAPGADEHLVGQPFVGVSGRLLKALLAKSNIDPKSCFYGNVCQVRPPANDISRFSWIDDEIQTGLSTLQADLADFSPNLCVLLGNTPLKAALPGKAKITSYRGSLFVSSVEGPFLGRKCLPAYHPAACLRQRDWIPVLQLDLSKAGREATSPDLRLPERTLRVDLFPSDIVDRLDAIVDQPISIDIEGGLDTMTCCSVALSPTDVFIVPFCHVNGKSYWPTAADETRIWRAFARVLTDRRVPKILQNSLYDNFVLSYSYRCPIINVADDTMLKHWELYSELPKGLGFQASIYTDEPYYKEERTIPDTSTHFTYCCKDSAVTYEINDRLSAALGNSTGTGHYRFNISLLPALLYMELRGIRYDMPGAVRRRRRIGLERDYYQCILDLYAGREMNTKSPKFKDYLYDELGLPEVTNRQTGSRTANYEALLKLAKKTNHPVPKIGLLLSGLRTRHQMLGISDDSDGRIRCGYNLVGTETGRLTCYTSPTGSGYNLQTIPEGDRDLFIADPDHWLFQCDLSGADTWTVAAHCHAQGDDRMLLDLRAGVKPAKILAYAFTHGPDILRATSEEVLELTASVAKTDPLYFGAKCCIHGCLTGDHEVLTPTGWIQIQDVADDTPIMTFDPRNQQARFETPSRYTRFDYTGSMYHWEGSSISQVVTADHKMLFATNGNLKYTTAANLATYKSGKLPLSASHYLGTPQPYARLIAAFHSDGSFYRDGWSFHFRKQRKIDRLEYLLQQAGWSYKKQANGDGTVTIYCQALDSIPKKLGPYVLAWDFSSLRAYVDEYPNWDGHIGRTSQTVFSVDQEHLDWIGTMSRLCGMGYTNQGESTSGFGSLVYRMNLNRRAYANIDNLDKKSRLEVTGLPVHCPTVSTGFFFVRHNGKISITGNSNYGMGKVLLSQTIFKQSDGSVNLSAKDAERLQDLYFRRYPGVQRWHAWIQRQLTTKRSLVSASGHRRLFFGMPNEHDTFKQALANEPQENTTFATNMAALRLWSDPDNRQPSGRLIVEPLHQVHDAILGQFPRDQTDFAIRKIREWFRNPMVIGGLELVIPFEGAYGRSWGELTEGKI